MANPITHLVITTPTWRFLILLGFCLAIAAPAANFDRQPDALISTKSLFQLPKDAIAAPILKDLLTEDFVFYYQDGGADWMSFRGTLARLAFEHRVDWPTRLLSWILNGPAEIALWKGDDGKLKHFMIVMDQTGVKDIAKRIVEAAAQDSQLANDPTGPQIQMLTLATGRVVYLSTKENRLFIFSDAAMKMPRQEEERSFVERAKSFFGENQDISIFGPKLGSAKHAITVSLQFLSFGYQAFFDELKAVRFEFTKGSGWSARILTSGKTKPIDAKLWSQMPKGAALCVTVPLDTKKAAAVIKAEEWLDKSNASAIACWYPDSKFFTPLTAMRGDFSALIKSPAELRKIFTRTIGVREAVWMPKSSDDSPPQLKYLPMLPVRPAKTAPGQIGFVREVGARYGLYPSDKSTSPQLLGSKKFFRVKLVATSEIIVFSADDRLVDKALTTIDGKFPSMASSLPEKGKSAWFIVAPDAFAKLAKASILDSLPDSQETIFRTAVSRHLLPNLEKFGKRRLQAASVEGSGDWKVIDWATNESR